MNARYYDPETGRFISEDTYRGDGEAFWHLYAYCDGDPVNNVDPTGKKPGDKFTSADEAAKDYAYYYGAITRIFKVETGAIIYSYMVGNKDWYYSYKKAAIGEPHRATGINWTLPKKKGAELVAYIHTHPNSNKFSGTDKSIADNRKTNAYVVKPDKKLFKYISSKRLIKCVRINLSFRHLSQGECVYYERKLHDVWYNHLPCTAWGCKKKKWPNWNWLKSM